MDLSCLPNHYSIEKVIGQGNFGVIYRGRNIETSEKVAIKVIKYKSGLSELQNEVKVLTKLQGGEGIPILKWYTKTANLYIMNLLGACLNDKFIKENKKISDQNFVLIAEQLLKRIEFMHSKNIIHRDIKPHQLVIDRKKRSKLYLIDFGLSKLYKGVDGTHVPYGEGKAFAGTFNYASIHAHLGVQQSRRDDLESYSYVLAYFINGDLPWRLSLSTQNEASIKKMKLSLKPSDLFPSHPSLSKIYSYIRSLKFDESPDYSYILSQILTFKSTILSPKPYFTFKSTRSSSKLNKSIKRRKKFKANTFVCINKLLEYDDFSATVIDKNYPELRLNKSPVQISESPTKDSLKSVSEPGCFLF